ncbi:MAG: arsenate reductase ArsC [Planctomycetota bacterium]
MTPKTRVLFLCTGNACRSQMAEAWARRLQAERFEARSAGTAPAGLDARAAQVMAEAGVDISGQRSKHVDEVAGAGFDLVVTLCDDARQGCPVPPGGAPVLHAPFEDPARARGGADEILAVFRRVRDEIRDLVAALHERLA